MMQRTGARVPGAEATAGKGQLVVVAAGAWFVSGSCVPRELRVEACLDDVDGAAGVDSLVARAPRPYLCVVYSC